MVVWGIASVVTILALLVYGRKGPNAVWGTATIGAVIGVGVATFQPGFDWWTVGKAVIIGTLIGVFFEMVPLIPRLWSKP